MKSTSKKTMQTGLAKLLSAVLLVGTIGLQPLAAFAQTDGLQEALAAVPPPAALSAASVTDSTYAPRLVEGDLSAPIESDQELVAFLDGGNGLGKGAASLAASPVTTQIVKKESDSAGRTHYFLQQQYKGLPVYGKYTQAHLTPERTLYAMSAPGVADSTELDGLSLDVNPSLDPSEAIRRLTASVEQEVGHPIQLGGQFGPRQLSEPKAELLIYPAEDDRYVLAYAVTLEYAAPSYGQWKGYVDAKTGQVLKQFSNVMDAQAMIGTGKSYSGAERQLHIAYYNGKNRLMDLSKPMFQAVDDNIFSGYLAVYDVQKPFDGAVGTYGTYFNDAPAVDAHYNAGLVYDYYYTELGRNSIDGVGGDIVSLVNAGPIDNAYWNGYEMVYGDGNSRFQCLSCALDVVAHELTHGVTQYASGLEYEGQSGALNESFSDVMAAVIDGANWTIGEEVGVIGSTYGVLRDLQNPARGAPPQPYLMKDYVVTDKDNGGVHANSGIPNYAAYLTAEGIDSIGGLQGQGRALLGQLTYSALTHYITPTADFIDARDAYVLAAGDLDLPEAQRTAVVQAVKQAWAAVGLPYTEDENNIVTFQVEGMEGPAIINPVAHTVNFTMPYLTCMTLLQPVVTVSPGATLTAGAQNQDYSKPATFTVRSKSGVDQTWTVVGQTAPPLTGKDILNFFALGQSGPAMIDAERRTVTVYGESDTNWSRTPMLLETSMGSQATPASQSYVNLDNPVSVTVTAQDGSQAVWTVKGVKDSSSPKLLQVHSSSRTSIYLIFNSSMRYNDLRTPSNYTIEPILPQDKAPIIRSVAVNADNAVTLTVDGLESDRAYRVDVSPAVRSSDGYSVRPDWSYEYVKTNDYAPPQLQTARVSGDELELTFNDSVTNPYYYSAYPAFKAYLNGVEVTSLLSGGTPSGRMLQFTLNQRLQPEDTLELSYAPTNYYKVKDLNNNELEGFDRIAVTNLTPVQPAVGEPGRLLYEGKLVQSLKHPSKPIVYSIYEGDRNIVSIHMETGETHTALMDKPVRRLTVTETEVVAALDYMLPYVEGQQQGGIVLLNPEDLTVMKNFTVPLDPYDVAVDRNGYIYASSAEDQWTELSSLSPVDGSVIMQAWTYEKTFIQYQPSVHRIYSITTNLSPTDITGFALNDKGEFTDPLYPGGEDSPYHGDYPMKAPIRTSPDGKYIFTAAGTIFKTVADRTQDLRYVQTVEPFEDIAFDLTQNRFYTLLDNVLTTWEYSSFTKLTQAQFTQPVKSILAAKPNELYLGLSTKSGRATALVTYSLTSGASAASQGIAATTGAVALADIANACPGQPGNGGGNTGGNTGGNNGGNTGGIPGGNTGGTGGGAGGGFGGGFGGVPMLPPEPEVPAPTQSMKTADIKRTQSQMEDGLSAVTVKPDAGKLVEALQAARTGADQSGSGAPSVPTVIIPVTDQEARVRVELPLQLLLDAGKEAKNTLVVVQTERGSYSLPLELLASAPVKQALGASTSPKATLSVQLSGIGTANTTSLQKAVSDQGFRLVADPLDFKLTVSDESGTREVHDFGGMYVRRSIILKEKVSGELTTVLVYDPATRTVSFVPSAVRFTEQGQPLVDVLAPHNSIYAVVQGDVKGFRDTSGHWAKAEVEKLASKLILQGVTEDTFAPEASITRAEFASILVRALGIAPSSEASPFRDVSAADWYYGSVNAAARAGLVTGVAADAFNPTGTITREEMAVMIARAMRFAGGSQALGSSTGGASSGAAAFQDWTQVSGWAAEDIALLTKAGILAGTSGGQFAPKASVTRAQAAVVLSRMLGQLGFVK